MSQSCGPGLDQQNIRRQQLEGGTSPASNSAFQADETKQQAGQLDDLQVSEQMKVDAGEQCKRKAANACDVVQTIQHAGGPKGGRGVAELLTIPECG